ncbi:hypothetical protein BDY24DRAFT_416219 [Mrakia frigida]|uniref:uncharacterized protein n=1 Tax=Mrakia frigida TaxID=29902 RepID=UPI003FCBF29D
MIRSRAQASFTAKDSTSRNISNKSQLTHMHASIRSFEETIKKARHGRERYLAAEELVAYEPITVRLLLQQRSRQPSSSSTPPESDGCLPAPPSNSHLNSSASVSTSSSSNQAHSRKRRPKETNQERAQRRKRSTMKEKDGDASSLRAGTSISSYVQGRRNKKR